MWYVKTLLRGLGWLTAWFGGAVLVHYAIKYIPYAGYVFAGIALFFMAMLLGALMEDD